MHNENIYVIVHFFSVLVQAFNFNNFGIICSTEISSRYVFYLPFIPKYIAISTNKDIFLINIS